MWFIPCFLLGELLFMILKSFSDKACLIFALGSVTVILACYNFPSYGWLQVIVRGVIAFTFFAFGYLLQKLCVLNKINWTTAFVLLLVGLGLSMINGFSDLGSLILNHPALYFLSAWILSTAILAVCRLFSNKGLNLNLLSMFGENSIVLLCTNNILIEVIRLLDYKLTGNMLIEWGIWGSVLFTTVLIVLEYVIIRFEKRFCPWFFGSIKLKTPNL